MLSCLFSGTSVLEFNGITILNKFMSKLSEFHKNKKIVSDAFYLIMSCSKFLCSDLEAHLCGLFSGQQSHWSCGLSVNSSVTWLYEFETYEWNIKVTVCKLLGYQSCMCTLDRVHYFGYKQPFNPTHLLSESDSLSQKIHPGKFDPRHIPCTHSSH